jgi:Tol biopolymer transport system component
MFNQPRERLFPTWLLWVIGPVTVVAAALIIFAVVLGIRAGQRQIETQRRQEVGIALQRAVDLQADGRLQDAVAEYRRVLLLEPGNEAAMAGIQAVVDQATTGEVLLVEPVVGGTPVASAPNVAVASAETPVASALMTPTTTTAVSAQDQTLYEQARTVYGTGEWEEAVTLLLQLQQQSPTFQKSQVDEMLYNAYVNLAAAADQADELETAIEYVDKALVLQPNSSALQAARAIAANYVEALQQEAIDLAKAVELYEAVYVQDPNYREVSTRLLAARFALGDQWALQKEWCKAEEQYTLALDVSVPPGSIARRDDFQTRCAQLLTLRGQGGSTPPPTATRAVIAAGEVTITVTPEPTSSLATTVDTLPDVTSAVTVAVDAEGTPLVEITPEVAAGEETPEPVVSGSVSGRLLYSALDPVNGQSNIYLQEVNSAQPQILFVGGTQPSLRADGGRMVFRDLRNGSRGLGAYDPATGLELRFSEFSEDAFPSWNALGNYIAFASTRESDRRWRLYVVWADVGNEAVSVGYGQYPDWHPSEDRFAYQGCDETGNNCGIRTMSSGGGDLRSMTSVATDMHPDWAGTGQFVAFASEGRDGNAEIYRVEAAGGGVIRLTENPSIDASPAVSPDGAWVAFLSNRSGSWAIWALPSSGGEAQQLFALEGTVNVWQDFEMEWMN